MIKNAMIMKKIMMILACVVAMTTFACEKYDDGRPSKDVRTEFNNMYPDAKEVEWDYEAGYWVVSFETGKAPNRIDHEAWYGADGLWIKTVTEYPLSMVPQGIKEVLAGSEYGSLPLEDLEVEYFETPDDKFYRFDLWKDGREVKVDVHENGDVTPAQYDMI